MPKIVIDEDMPRSTGIIGKFKDLSEDDFKGNLIIIEPRKIRIRRVERLGIIC